MSLRVLVISHSYPHPAGPIDGHFVHQQVRRLVERGVSIHVLSPVPLAPPVPALGSRMKTAMTLSRAKPLRWAVDGVEVEYPRYLKLPGQVDLGLFGPLFYRGIRAHVHKLHRQQPFDLVHGQWLVPDGYAAARLGRELSIPSLSTERGYAARYPRSGPRYAAIRRTIEALDQVITVSEALAEQVRERGTPKRPIRVVYTGVDNQAFGQLDQSAARHQLGLPAGRYLVCCARLEAVKQPDLLLDSFARVHEVCPDAHLVWVGEGQERERLGEQAARRGLRDLVHLPGSVEHAAVRTWLSAADVVVLASKSEGLPNALVEASATGRPIVATRVGGIPEVVEHERTGLLVEPDDAEGLAEAVLLLLNDSDKAQTFGRQARTLALQRFCWNRHVDQMIEIYQSLMVGRN